MINDKLVSDLQLQITRLTPTTLYNNPSGGTGTITLSDNVNNYSYLEIFYGWGSYGHSSTKYDTSSSNDGIDLFSTLFNNNRIYWTTSHFTATGNQLVLDDAEYWSLGTSGTASRSQSSNRNFIYKVIGYK